MRYKTCGLTTKQRQIMQIIIDGNGLDAGGLFTPIDLDQLVSRLPYTPSKESMQFSIRALVQRGFVQKGDCTFRRGRRRVVYFATELGKRHFSMKVELPVVEPEGLSELGMEELVA